MTETERFIKINEQILELHDKLNSVLHMTEKLSNAVSTLAQTVQAHKHEISRLNLRTNYVGDKKR